MLPRVNPFQLFWYLVTCIFVNPLQINAVNCDCVLSKHCVMWEIIQRSVYLKRLKYTANRQVFALRFVLHCAPSAWKSNICDDWRLNVSASAGGMHVMVILFAEVWTLWRKSVALSRNHAWGATCDTWYDMWTWVSPESLLYCHRAMQAVLCGNKT